MRRGIRRFLIGLIIVVALPAGYYAAAIAGAYVGAGGLAGRSQAGTAQKTVDVLLLSGPIHADFALPADEALLRRFAFLSESGLPLGHPDLRYLVFGWGARDFYTTAGSYTSIRPMAALKAVFGDRTVMHVVAGGALSEGEGIRRITLDEEGYAALIGHIEEGFARGASGAPILIGNESHGYGDVFYEGTGAFHIFRPCNVWAGEGLRKAGIGVGAWTPTVQSLNASLDFAGY